MNTQDLFLEKCRELVPHHVDSIESCIGSCETLEQMTDSVFRECKYLGGVAHVIAALIKKNL